jgi:hypothetical protein
MLRFASASRSAAPGRALCTALRLASSSSSSSSSPSSPPTTGWDAVVSMMNTSLRDHPRASIVTIIALEAATVYGSLGLLDAAGVQLPPEFAVAFAANRVLRRIRLPADLLVSGAVAHLFPGLAQVRGATATRDHAVSLALNQDTHAESHIHPSLTPNHTRTWGHSSLSHTSFTYTESYTHTWSHSSRILNHAHILHSHRIIHTHEVILHSY